MAELYERLPTVNDSARNTVAPAPLADTLATDALNFAARAAPIVGDVIEGNRQAKKDKAKAADDAAVDTVLGELPDVLGLRKAYQDDPTALSAIDEAGAVASRITTLTEANGQGRGVSVEAGRLKSEVYIRDVMARFPGHRAIIFKVLKEAGVVTRATQEYDRAEELLAKDQEAALALENKIEEVIVTRLGQTNYHQLSKEEQASLRVSAGELLAKETQLDMKMKRASIIKQEIDINTEEGKAVSKSLSKNLLQGALDTIGPNFDALMRGMTTYVFDPSFSDADKDAKISEFLRFHIPEMKRLWGQTSAQIITNMESEDIKTLNDHVESRFKDLTDFLTGPASIVESRKRELETISNILEIDMGKVLPLWSRIRGAKIGGEALSALMTNEVLMRGNVLQGLQKEFSAAAQDNFLDESDVKIHLNRTIRLLNGEDNVLNFGADEVKKLAPTLVAAMDKMAKNPKITSGQDEDSHFNLMLAAVNAADITKDVDIQWGFGTVLENTLRMQSKGLIQSFSVAKNSDEQATALRSYVPAMTKSIRVLSEFNAGDQYYQLHWNSQKKAYEAKWNGKLAPSREQAGTNAMSAGAGGPMFAPSQGAVQRVKPPVPTNLQLQVKALNNGIGILTDLSRKGWDEFIDRKTPDAEVRTYYGLGRPTSAMKDAAKKKSSKDEVDSLTKILRENLKKLEEAPAYQKGSVTDPRSERNNNPGNIKVSSWTEKQPGYVGPDKDGYAIFDSPESGQKAQAELLASKGYYGGGRKTVASIIEKWAPRASAGGDNTDEQVNNYISYVANKLGVDPNSVLSANLLPQMARFMHEFESGNKS